MDYGEYLYDGEKYLTWVFGLPEVAPSSARGRTARGSVGKRHSGSARTAAGDWLSIERTHRKASGFEFRFSGRKPAGFKGVIVLPSVPGEPPVRVNIFTHQVL